MKYQYELTTPFCYQERLIYRKICEIYARQHKGPKFDTYMHLKCILPFCKIPKSTLPAHYNIPPLHHKSHASLSTTLHIPYLVGYLIVANHLSLYQHALKVNHIKHNNVCFNKVFVAKL